jgi:hypothetical protein
MVLMFRVKSTAAHFRICKGLLKPASGPSSLVKGTPLLFLNNVLALKELILIVPSRPLYSARRSLDPSNHRATSSSLDYHDDTVSSASSWTTDLTRNAKSNIHDLGYRASEEDNNAALADDYDLFLPEELLLMTDTEFNDIVEPWQEEEIMASTEESDKESVAYFHLLSSDDAHYECDFGCSNHSLY